MPPAATTEAGILDWQSYSLGLMSESRINGFMAELAARPMAYFGTGCG